MELLRNVRSFLRIRSDHRQSRTSSSKSKRACFPFSMSRMTDGVTHQLFPRHQRRSLKINKHQSQLTTNMDSYQSTPSDNELQQLLYA